MYLVTTYRVRHFCVLGICVFLATLFTIGCFIFLYQTLVHPSVPIENIQVSNLSENSLTLSWVSYKPTRAKVYYSHSPISSSARIILRVLPMNLISRLFDLKVIGDDFGLVAATVHHVTLKDLKPETEYYYLISTGRQFYSYDKEGQSLPLIRTAVSLESAPFPYPCYGKVLDFAEEAPEAPLIVYAFSAESGLISAYTNSLGNYSLDLGSLRTKDNQGLFDLNQNRVLVLEVEGGQWGKITQPLYFDECQPIKTINLE